MNLVSILTNAPSPLRLINGVRKAAVTLTRQAVKGAVNYPGMVEQAAAMYADNVLIKYQDRQLTYAGFNGRCNQIARYLKAQGLGSGDVIALYMENRLEYLLYMTAITKTGAVAALINHSQQGKVLTHSINLVSARAVIAGEELLEPLSAVTDSLDYPADVFAVPDPESKSNELISGYVNIEQALRDYSEDNLPEVAQIDADSPCLYIYTSGTTGLPKAAIQRHKKLAGLATGLGMLSGAVTSRDTVYSTLPLYHGTALFFSWLSVFANGATLAIRRKFSASEFWQDVIDYDATVFVYVGELCRYLLNQRESPLDRQHRVHLVTGNGLRPDLWDEFKSRFGIREIREFYGSSEGNLACYNLFNQDKTMGMVLGSYAVVKIDTESEEPVKDSNGHLIRCDKGEPGLLLGRITRVTPFDGYTDEEKNESKVIHDAFRSGDAWFNTGDLVKEQGWRHLQFVDRLGDTYRWKGENVSTGEVEMIVNQYPRIRESIAYGVEIPDTNGRAGMVAVVLEENEQSLDAGGLYQYLKAELPSYAVPVFVRTLNSVSATGTFKYQRNHLKKQGYDKSSFDDSSDEVYVALPGSDSYCPLTDEVFEKLKQGEYRF